MNFVNNKTQIEVLSEKTKDNPYNPPKIISKRQFISILAVLILLTGILLTLAFNDEIFRPSSEDNEKSEEGNDDDKNDTSKDTNYSSEYKTPIISNINTASNVAGNKYSSCKSFNQGEKIFIWFEYENINHNGTASAYVNLTVTNDVFEYKKTFDVPSDDLYCSSINFLTNDSWSEDVYTAKILLFDKISNKSVSEDVDFNLYNSSNPVSRPQVQINPNVTIGYAPLNVSFNAFIFNMSGDFVFEWDFDGDGYVDSYNENPCHIFTDPGTIFNTILSVSNDSSSAVDSVDINVRSDPEVELWSQSDLSGKAPFDVSFMIVTYNFIDSPSISWDFDGDLEFEVEGIEKNQTYTYESPGEYNVRIFVSGNGFDFVLGNCTVKVLEDLGTLEANITKTNVTGFSCSFEGKGSGGTGEYSYSWEVIDAFTNGSSERVLYEGSQKNVSYNFENEDNGLYYFKLIVEDGENSAEETFWIEKTDTGIDF